MRIGFREMLTKVRSDPLLTVHMPDHEPISGVYFAFVSNASPWTYVNSRPVWTNPGTTFDTNLGIFAVTSMNTVANLLLVRRMLSRKAKIEARHLIREDDLPWVRITAAEPIACQIDGEFLGKREEMTFTSVPDALAVVARQTDRGTKTQGLDPESAPAE